MKTFLLRICFIFSLLFVFPILSHVHASVLYGNGYYTNLCGTSTTATADTCNKGCDPALGTCTAEGINVVKFICDGNLPQCRINVSDFAKSQSVSNATCGKTVEIDVYKKMCQTIFGWFCTVNDVKDYMVWYSGDCAGSTLIPTPTITQAVSVSCNSLTVTSGNGGRVPATVSYTAQGSGNVSLYRFYFGDGTFAENVIPTVSHLYESSGVFTARVYTIDSHGNWVTSPGCKTQTTISSISLETHKSGCSNLHIVSGNYTKAPTMLTFEVTGYDNKGAIKEYKIDFGNGETQIGTNNVFSRQYSEPGTYTARAYVLDSQNNWLTATGCEQSVYATTETLTSQPGTGTPTWYTVLAIVSGVIASSMILSWQWSQVKRSK